MAGRLVNQSNSSNEILDLLDIGSSPSVHYHLEGITFIVYAINCAFNVVLSFIATFGNLVVLLALRKTVALHPPSKALLSGLALSDLAVGLITQPVFVVYTANSLSQQRLQVGTSSTIAISILGILLSAVSLMTLAVISIDRILALRLKTRYRQEVTLIRVILVLIAVWLLAGVAATVCYIYKTQVIALALLLACVAVTSINYLNIFRALRQHRTRLDCNAGTSGIAEVCFRRSVRSALYVYLALLLCSLPYLCVGAVSFLVGWNTTLLVSRHISETVVYLNSSLNPLLYCWISRDFKRAVWTTLKIPCSDE